MAKQEPISFTELVEKFNNEKACHDHLYKMKWPNDFRCPRCNHDKATEIYCLFRNIWTPVPELCGHCSGVYGQ